MDTFNHAKLMDHVILAHAFHLYQLLRAPTLYIHLSMHTTIAEPSD